MDNLSALETLFEGVMAGDPLAREQMYRRYESQLRCTLWTFSRDMRYGHSDMVQSAFCHLFEDVAAGKIRLKSEREVFGLLVRYAHNRARTGKRRDRIALNHADRYALTRHTTEPQPSEVLEVAELVEYMRSQLSPIAAQVVEKKLSGESFEQIAEQLEKSHAAVEKIYYRTLAYLRDQTFELVMS